MSRHCVHVKLNDGSWVNLQFGKPPTEAEIKAAKDDLEKDLATIKNGLKTGLKKYVDGSKPRLEEEYP